MREGILYREIKVINGLMYDVTYGVFCPRCLNFYSYIDYTEECLDFCINPVCVSITKKDQRKLYEARSLYGNDKNHSVEVLLEKLNKIYVDSKVFVKLLKGEYNLTIKYEYRKKEEKNL